MAKHLQLDTEDTKPPDVVHVIPPCCFLLRTTAFGGFLGCLEIDLAHSCGFRPGSCAGWKKGVLRLICWQGSGICW